MLIQNSLLLLCYKFKVELSFTKQVPTSGEEKRGNKKWGEHVEKKHGSTVRKKKL